METQTSVPMTHMAIGANLVEHTGHSIAAQKWGILPHKPICQYKVNRLSDAVGGRAGRLNQRKASGLT